MNYREDRYGNRLSILGYGCMRFPRKMGAVDMEKTEHQVMTAIKNGVNYFDTAFIYPGSESAIGEVFEKNNSVFGEKVFHVSSLAEKVNAKLPQHLA